MFSRLKGVYSWPLSAESNSKDNWTLQPHNLLICFVFVPFCL